MPQRTNAVEPPILYRIILCACKDYFYAQKRKDDNGMKGSVRKKGDTWYYRIELGMVDGKRKQKEKGGFRLKKDCESAMNKAIHDLENNFVLPDEKLTLDNIVQNYLEHTKLTRKLNTYKRYEGLYNMHVKKEFGDLKAMRVTPERLEKLLFDKNFLAGGTLQIIFTVINSSYNRAIKQKKLNDNPCKYIDRPQRKKPKTEVLTADEATKVLSQLNLDKYNEYIMYLALCICLELGLRRGELAALQWKHIDKNKKTISIKDNLIYVNGHTYLNTEDLKTDDSESELPISDELLFLLEQHRKKQLSNKIKYGQNYIKNEYNDEYQNFIMTWENGKVVHPNYYTSRIKKVMKKLGINKNIRFHDLRHTNAVLLIQQDVDFKTLQKRLRHADFSTTMNIYADHIIDELQRNATNKISSIIHKAK